MKVEVAGDPETGSVAQRRNLGVRVVPRSSPHTLRAPGVPRNSEAKTRGGNRSRPDSGQTEELLQQSPVERRAIATEHRRSIPSPPPALREEMHVNGPDRTRDSSPQSNLP